MNFFSQTPLDKVKRDRISEIVKWIAKEGIESDALKELLEKAVNLKDGFCCRTCGFHEYTITREKCLCNLIELQVDSESICDFYQ